VARYEATIDIARPPRVVFDFFDTPENAPRYVEGTVTTTLIGGVRKGVGTRVIRVTIANRATPLDATEEVVEYVDGSLKRSRGTAHWYAHYEAVMRVEPADTGSRVTLIYDYRPTVTAILVLPFWPLFLLAMRGRMQKMAAAAKRVLEAEDAGAYRAAG